MFCRRVNGADQGRSEAVDRMARPAYARRSTGGLLQDGEPLARMRPARQGARIAAGFAGGCRWAGNAPFAS